MMILSPLVLNKVKSVHLNCLSLSIRGEDDVTSTNKYRPDKNSLNVQLGTRLYACEEILLSLIRNRNVKWFAMWCTQTTVVNSSMFNLCKRFISLIYIQVGHLCTSYVLSVIYIVKQRQCMTFLI